jgi:hypothetical protein
VEHWDVDENTNFDVFEESKENYPRLFKYVEAQVNALDELPQSSSHQRNPKLDQTRYIVETRDHEFLLPKVCALCEEKGHAIMDCPFMPFHIKAIIARHVELQNVVGALMDQP